MASSYLSLGEASRTYHTHHNHPRTCHSGPALALFPSLLLSSPMDLPHLIPHPVNDLKKNHLIEENK